MSCRDVFGASDFMTRSWRSDEWVFAACCGFFWHSAPLDVSVHFSALETQSCGSSRARRGCRSRQEFNSQVTWHTNAQSISPRECTYTPCGRARVQNNNDNNANIANNDDNDDNDDDNNNSNNKNNKNNKNNENNQNNNNNNRLVTGFCARVAFFMAESCERPNGGVARRRRERRMRSWFRHEQQSIRMALAAELTTPTTRCTPSTALHGARTQPPGPGGEERVTRRSTRPSSGRLPFPRRSSS